ncbi:MAG: SsrA-binding protein SmpB [Candidatus Nomurabacteria bacterium]|jgi:SsrA-binding protein|nr:SsrA-binding protein SmpB [Candidatus Nomurabacteria bacterium]
MKKAVEPKSIVNRRARFDYDLGEDVVVGLVLTGAETKAARLGHVQLKGSYVTVKDDELWLLNASFSVKTGEKGGGKAVDTRSRKLLAHRRQINDLIEAKKQGLTIVPVKMLTNGHYIKLIIATARGKKRYDKRETIKRRDIERETRRALKSKLN